jgi:hypothetical protein
MAMKVLNLAASIQPLVTVDDVGNGIDRADDAGAVRGLEGGPHGRGLLR